MLIGKMMFRTSLHLGFVHTLQDVALHQCLPCCLPCTVLFQVVLSFFATASCHLRLGRPLDLFPVLGCCLFLTQTNITQVTRVLVIRHVPQSVTMFSLNFCYGNGPGIQQERRTIDGVNAAQSGNHGEGRDQGDDQVEDGKTT